MFPTVLTVNGLYFDTDSISTRCRNRVHVEIESIGGPYFDNILSHALVQVKAYVSVCRDYTG